MHISGEQLKKWGLPSGPVFKVAIDTFREHKTKPYDAEDAIRGIIQNPESWLQTIYAPIAQVLIDARPKVAKVRDKCVPTKVFGEGMIEPGALAQLYTAAKLPISVQAAIMPDGHEGYGLPIGGVLATDNTVIPFAVGFDIGCRMHMSVLPIEERECRGKDKMFVKTLIENTVFGKGKEQDGNALMSGSELAVLDDTAFRDIPALKRNNVLATASQQIGTSGSGNHFVEFGFLRHPGYGEEMLAILSHSGSRGMGHRIATIYSELALKRCSLSGSYKRLAWLSLDDDDGREYWEAMQLAGRYAQACHAMIHRRLCKALKVKPEHTFENHHNFAWKMKIPVTGGGEFKQVIVHRKGATPAEEGVVGIIPGSMTTPTYLVKGKGNPESLFSSSHGAGRLMSRSAAKQTFTMSQMRKNIEEAGIILVGGSLDECSMAYKDIEQVISEQSELVEPLAKFRPWIVRMAEEDKRPWQKSKECGDE